MKMLCAFLAFASLLGATQLAEGQAKASTPPPIPGFYNPTTGQFTAQVTGASRTPQPDVQAALAGTSVFFREDF